MAGLGFFPCCYHRSSLLLILLLAGRTGAGDRDTLLAVSLDSSGPAQLKSWVASDTAASGHGADEGIGFQLWHPHQQAAAAAHTSQFVSSGVVIGFSSHDGIGGPGVGRAGTSCQDCGTDPDHWSSPAQLNNLTRLADLSYNDLTGTVVCPTHVKSGEHTSRFHSSGVATGVVLGFSSHKGIGGAGGGREGMSCQDCGNKAKKDCTHMRCRTCCRSRGFSCPTHVKNTCVPAAKRRERQQQLAAPPTATARPPPQASKRPRELVRSLGRLPSANSAMVSSTTTSSGDGSGRRFRPELSVEAVFRCVRIGNLRDHVVLLLILLACYRRFSLLLVVLLFLHHAGAVASQPIVVAGDDHRGLKRRHIIILLAVLPCILVVCCSISVIVWLLFRRRRNGRARREVTVDSEMIVLDVVDDIREVTPADWKMTAFCTSGQQEINFTAWDVVSNIHDENVIGIGGSGKVYRVNLGTTTRNRMVVAVKRFRLPRNRHDGESLEKQLEAEVKVLGTLRHSNIVRLLCCCTSTSQEGKLLVYECMENGSLGRWLHEPGAGAPLDWPTRLAIAIDAAKGLSYLHHDCEQPIVNCDVKSCNILLGPGFKAKIGDFGLAKILGSESVSSSDVGGTPGYMAPEILKGARANVKLDVYSFGVVLLELTTGKKATDGGGDADGMGLAGWARRRYHEGGTPFDDMIDEAIRRNPSDMQAIQSVFTLGVTCTSDNPLERPSMEQVLHQLTLIIISPETTTEACLFQQVDSDGGCGGGEPLLQNRRRGTWIRRLSSRLMIITSTTSRRSIISGGRMSQQGLELLLERIRIRRGSSESRVISCGAQMHAAHTN